MLSLAPWVVAHPLSSTPYPYILSYMVKKDVHHSSAVTTPENLFDLFGSNFCSHSRHIATLFSFCSGISWWGTHLANFLDRPSSLWTMVYVHCHKSTQAPRLRILVLLYGLPQSGLQRKRQKSRSQETLVCQNVGHRHLSFCHQQNVESIWEQCDMKVHCHYKPTLHAQALHGWTLFGCPTYTACKCGNGYALL